MVLTFHSDFFPLSHGAFPLHLLSLPKEGVSRCEGLASDVSMASASMQEPCDIQNCLRGWVAYLGLLPLNHLQKQVKTICSWFDGTRDPEQRANLKDHVNHQTYQKTHAWYRWIPLLFVEERDTLSPYSTCRSGISYRESLLSFPSGLTPGGPVSDIFDTWQAPEGSMIREWPGAKLFLKPWVVHHVDYRWLYDDYSQYVQSTWFCKKHLHPPKIKLLLWSVLACWTLAELE